MGKPPSEDGAPWWRFGMVWLVIAGPVSVLLAGAVTLVLVLRGADTPLHETAAPQAGAQAPALQARNHVAAAHR
jgi:uncharacterized protein